MKRYKGAIRALHAAAIALFLVAGTPRTAWAKAFEIRDETWEGCSELYDLARAELGPGRVLPRGDLTWSELLAGDAILVLHPERAINYDNLAAFLQAGGRVAILDDFGAADHVLSPMGVFKAPTPVHPVEALRGNAELALAEPIAAHPALAGVERIALNHPTALRSVALTPVLRIANAQGPDAMLAFAGEPDPDRSRGGGKVFVMGDPSALINHMLRYPGNRTFASSLVRFLTRQNEGGRGKLYVVANDFGEVGTFGSPDLAAELDARLATLRTAAAATLADGFSGTLGWTFGAAFALALAGLTVRSCVGSRRRRIPGFARTPSLVAQGGAAGRAALLAEPGAARGLLLLELKCALEEGVMKRLGLSGRPDKAALVEAARGDATLDQASERSFREVLDQMTRVQSRMVQRRPERVRQADLQRAARWVAHVLSAARETQG